MAGSAVCISPQVWEQVQYIDIKLLFFSKLPLHYQVNVRDIIRISQRPTMKLQSGDLYGQCLTALSQDTLLNTRMAL